jgi:hypothetical protein
MATKLTLSIDESVIRDAKEYAQKTGRSVSQLVESYLKAITHSTKKKKSKLPPHLKRWHGAFKIEDERDYKEIIEEAIWEKYNI